MIGINKLAVLVCRLRLQWRALHEAVPNTVSTPTIYLLHLSHFHQFHVAWFLVSFLFDLIVTKRHTYKIIFVVVCQIRYLHVIFTLQQSRVFRTCFLSLISSGFFWNAYARVPKVSVISITTSNLIWSTKWRIQQLNLWFATKFFINEARQKNLNG